MFHKPDGWQVLVWPAEFRARDNIDHWNLLLEAPLDGDG